MSIFPYVTIRLQSFPTTAISSYLPLSLLVLSAVTFRLLWMHFLTGTIDDEGAEYARIAENLLSGKGYVGIATEGTELMFPPLFPFLIAAVTLLVHQAELASRLVSVIMGTALVLPVYFISLHMYDRKTAYVSAMLVAFHPLLINLSATLYCESTYITLVLAGAYWSMRCQSFDAERSFLLAGLFFGLAYLTRPEASLYPFLTILLIVAYVALTNVQQLRQVASRSCLLLTAFLILTAPYVAWLSSATGQLRLEGKSPINYSLAQRLVAGMDSAEAGTGMDRNLTEQGLWMKTNLSVIQSTAFKTTEVMHIAMAEAKNNIPFLIQSVLIGAYFGCPILFGLAVFGLYRTTWNRELIANESIFFMILGVATLSLLFIYYVTTRFCFIFLPVMIVWASKGIIEVSQWAVPIIRKVHSGLSPKRAEMAVRLASISAVLWVALIGIAHVENFRNFDFRYRPVRTAGEWVREFMPGPKTVMDANGILAFHAGDVVGALSIFRLIVSS